MVDEAPPSTTKQPRRILARPLLPAPAPQNTSVQAAPPTDPLTTGSRSRSTPGACDRCRQAKTKCTGERPVCSRCRQQGLQCHYAGRPGETTNKILKRENRDLALQVAGYNRLVKFLDEIPPAKALDIISKLNTGTPVDKVLKQLASGDAVAQLAVKPQSQFRYTLLYQNEMPAELTHNNPYLDTLIYEGDALYTSSDPHRSLPTPPSLSPEMTPDTLAPYSAYLMPFHSAQVMDPLLGEVRPSDWTTVSTDDGLMRELLSVWLRCEYVFTSAFQKDYFLEDMSSGNRDFCSELLVNSVLAYSCICSPSLPGRSEYWNPQNLAYRFLAEAKRLWELEATEPCLTTIHAGVILNVFHNLSGLDAIGQVYRLNSIALARKLQLFDGHIQGQNRRIRDGRLYTAWALFCWEAIIAFSFQKPPQIPKPPPEPLPDPAADPGWYGEIWVKYPNSQSLYCTNFSVLFKARAELRIIMHRFCAKAYTNGVKVSLKEAYALYLRLKRWEEGLPTSLMPKHIVLPAQIELHLYLHHLTLAMFEPSVDDVIGAELLQYPSPRVIVAEATRNMHTLIRIYRLRHGFEAMHLFIVIPLIFLGYRCLESIPKITDESELNFMRSTLMLVVNGLWYQRQNHYLAEALYHVVRGLMRPEEKALAKEASELEEDESEGTVILKQTVRSHWPVSVVKRKEDQDASILANLVEDLTLRESAGSSPS